MKILKSQPALKGEGNTQGWGLLNPLPVHFSLHHHSATFSTSDTRKTLQSSISFTNEKQRGRPLSGAACITTCTEMGTHPVLRREGKGHFFIINYTQGSFSELIHVILLFFNLFPHIFWEDVSVAVRDNLWVSHVDPRDQTLVIRLGSNCLYALIHSATLIHGILRTPQRTLVLAPFYRE